MSDLEKAANPKYYELLSEVKNLNAVTVNQTLAVDAVKSAVDDVRDAIIAKGARDVVHYKKVCKRHKLKDRLSNIAMIIMFTILAADLYNNEGSIIHNTVRILKALW